MSGGVVAEAVTARQHVRWRGWVRLAFMGYQAENDVQWARKLFGFSIIAITALSVMMSVDFQIPGDVLLTYAR